MIKLGLTLGGGGARGSYQLGVIKALMEENLLEDLKVVSGTSIGSFNSCLLMEKMSFDEMYNIWSNINNEILYKESIDLLRTERHGMFDQTKMYDILVQYSNKEAIINSPITGYVTACKIGDNSVLKQLKRSSMEVVHLRLNESEDPHLAVLASASMPLIFGATEINGEYYVDGGMLNNLPLDPLENEECNVMIVVSLSKSPKLELTNPNSLVVDFSPKNHISITPIGILDFSKENLDSRVELGYETAMELINQLKEDEIIKDGKWNLKQFGIYK